MVQGQPTDWEPGLVIAPAGGTIYEVYNAVREKRKPVAIRIQNTGTQAIKWAVNCAKLDANNQLLAVPDLGQMKDQYTGITSGGSVAEDGLGGIEIFKLEKTKSIFLYAAAGYNCVISKRYAQSN